MNCTWCEERFERFLDGELAPRDRAALLFHVERCRECHAVLDELRVVDALLMTPREVTLGPNFTHETMASVSALPVPAKPRSMVLAYVISYTVAAWLVIGAAFVLEPGTMHAVGATLAALGASLAGAFGGVGHAVSRLAERTGNAPLAIGTVVAFNVMVVLGVWGAIGIIRPRVAERLRS